MATIIPMKTNFAGRLRNVSLPKTKALFPLFEAVVNSIHAVEKTENPLIKITIERERQKDSDRTRILNIEGFRIWDNGVGFNDENFNSFNTFDSDYKKTKGCRGIGRLLWLKAFESVFVESVFQEGSEYKYRQFLFNEINGTSQYECVDCGEENGSWTEVRLIKFKRNFQEEARKAASSIANDLLEHLLWYYIRPGGAPSIEIYDGDDAILMDDVFSGYAEKEELKEAGFNLKGKEFTIVHSKIKKSGPHRLIYCAGERVVKSVELKIPGLFGKIGKTNNNEGYVYAGFLTSSFLDESVCQERTGFNFPEKLTEPQMKQKNLLTEALAGDEIQEMSEKKIKQYLSEFIEENIEKANEKLEALVSQKMPQYRHVSKNLQREEVAQCLSKSDKDIELWLYSRSMDFAETTFRESQDLFREREGETESEREIRIDKAFCNISEVNKSNLCRYVFHRKAVLDFLEEATKIQVDGNYQRESVIHDLIMKRNTTSKDMTIDNNNLWVIDERLVFHNYIVSDMSFRRSKLSASDSENRPDVLSLRLDNPEAITIEKNPPYMSMSIIEFKRPMRQDSDPIDQCFGYIEEIRNNEVRTFDGRPVNAESIPIFCYIICDITKDIERACNKAQLRRTYDGCGYFGFNSNINTYFEVISFDRLLKSAKERNNAFFVKLGLSVS